MNVRLTASTVGLTRLSGDGAACADRRAVRREHRRKSWSAVGAPPALAQLGTASWACSEDRCASRVTLGPRSVDGCPSDRVVRDLGLW